MIKHLENDVAGLWDIWSLDDNVSLCKDISQSFHKAEVLNNEVNHCDIFVNYFSSSGGAKSRQHQKVPLACLHKDVSWRAVHLKDIFLCTPTLAFWSYFCAKNWENRKQAWNAFEMRVWLACSAYIGYVIWHYWKCYCVLSWHTQWCRSLYQFKRIHAYLDVAYDISIGLHIECARYLDLQSWLIPWE